MTPAEAGAQLAANTPPATDSACREAARILATVEEQS